MNDDVTGQAGVAVLGPTSIGGGEVTPKQRALLASLVLHRRAGACIDQLSDCVWGGRPPATARSSLQNQMSRLRRVHGDDVIVCDRGRYRVGVPVDIDQFESLVRTALTASDDRHATRELPSALALWRGTPYHDIGDAHAADVERTRLEQLRTHAVERLAAARIALGRPEQAVVDLRQHVQVEPFRDQPRELLLIALHLAGCTAEALAAHHDYIELLEDELQVAPSARLEALALALARGESIRLGDVGAEVGSAGCGQAERHVWRTGRRCRSRLPWRPAD